MASTKSLGIIHLLADGRFHSGEELGRLLGVSRVAVWKRLQLLQVQLGLHFESVRGRGYRLVGGLELLDAERVRSLLPEFAADWLGVLEVHGVIDSTNRRASQIVQGGGHDCRVVIVAEHQVAGSGRRGRRWLSPFGRNIYCSTLWTFDGGVAALDGLSLVIGVVVTRVLAPLSDSAIQLKWPNDVLVEGQKLAGILLEVVGDIDGRCTVIIGIGINVDMHGAAELADIDQAWTDVASISRAPVSRNELLSALIAELVRALRVFEIEGFAAFREEWERRDYLKGKLVAVESGGRHQSGVVHGLDLTGALLVDFDGEMQVVHGGEVSVRARR